MADTVSPKIRSAMMRSVRNRHTQPEIAVRRAAHKLGYRFRLHRKDLPGTPDIVFPRLRVVFFVHGCFWHQHADCSRSRLPTTRRRFWKKKLLQNVARDAKATKLLQASGWRVCEIWECQTRNPLSLESFIMELLSALRPTVPTGDPRMSVSRRPSCRG
jgi:DNA mismatch endonuclease (patch repair protein)